MATDPRACSRTRPAAERPARVTRLLERSELTETAAEGGRS